jgi:predicted signal transduction protein with EAL and GGDEF domain
VRPLKDGGQAADGDGKRGHCDSERGQIDSERGQIDGERGHGGGPQGAADELFRNADLALWEAKSGGRDRYAVFESGMQTAFQDQLTLEMDLADALAEHQLFVAYQPMCDLHSERVMGVEALLRWRHPERGVIKPAELVPLAEHSGLIVPIGAGCCAKRAGRRRCGAATATRSACL